MYHLFCHAAGFPVGLIKSNTLNISNKDSTHKIFLSLGTLEAYSSQTLQSSSLVHYSCQLRYHLTKSSFTGVINKSIPSSS